MEKEEWDHREDVSGALKCLLANFGVAQDIYRRVLHAALKRVLHFW